MLTAKEIMTKEPVSVSPETHIFEAMKTLLNAKVTGLPVVDNQNELVGILSEKDVMGIAYKVMTRTYDSNTDGKFAGDFMTENITTFGIEDSVAEICKCFSENSFRRVLIVDDKKLVGVLSRKDIVKYLFGS